MAELQAPHPRALEAVRIRSAILPEDRAGMLAVLETANMHRVPCSEMHDLDVGEWYVAERAGRIVGVAGHRLERREGRLVGKTTLLAVLPSERTHGVGRSLQELRMSRLGARGRPRWSPTPIARRRSSGTSVTSATARSARWGRRASSASRASTTGPRSRPRCP